MKKIFFFLLLVISTTIYGQSIEIGQEALYVKTAVEWSTSKQNKSNPLKKASEPYWTWDSKYVDGVLTEVSQCYQNQYLIDFQIKIDYCERYIIQNGKLHHTIKEFKDISLDHLKAKYTSSYAIHKIGEMYFDSGFGYYYTFSLNQFNLACVGYYKTNLDEWDKTTQKKFNAEKKAIEKKQFEATMKDLMSDKKNYDKEINMMQTEIRQYEAEKSQNSINEENIITTKLSRSRKILVRPTPKYRCNEWGVVAVSVTVDSSGKVLEATAGSKGTTNFAECLLEEAKSAALHTRWEPLYNTNEQQAGSIIYTFKTTD